MVQHLWVHKHFGRQTEMVGNQEVLTASCLTSDGVEHLLRRHSRQRGRWLAWDVLSTSLSRELSCESVDVLLGQKVWVLQEMWILQEFGDTGSGWQSSA